jgi:hypothetical protein
LFNFVAERLAFFRAVDATEPDSFGVLIMQDFDRVAVEDGDDRAGEAGEG